LIPGFNASTPMTRARSLADLRTAAAGRRRRRLPRAPRMVYPDSAERMYARGIIELLERMRELTNKLLIPRLPAILAHAKALRPRADAAPTPADARADAYDDDIRDLMALMRASVGDTFSEEELRAMAVRVAHEIAALNAREVSKTFQQVLKVDLFASEPWLNPEVQAFVRSNVALIKTIPDRYLAEVETLVYDGARSGLRFEEIADDIASRFDVSASRAALIARDQVGKFNGQVNEFRQTQSGVTRYRWRGRLDARERPEHLAREGQIFSWDAPPFDGHPGQPIQCFPGSTPVGHFHDVFRAFRRRCETSLAFVVTQSGTRLEATPNHPVLTLTGWKALKDVKVGDYVIKAAEKRALIGEKNEEHGQTAIEEIFGLAFLCGDVGATEGHASQFHGDGSAQEIDVVTVDRGLGAEIDSIVAQALLECILSMSDVIASGLDLTTHGALTQEVETLRLSPNSSMGRIGKLAALFRAQSPHPQEIRLAAASRFHEMLKKSAADCPAVDAVFFGKGHLAGSGSILGNDLLLGKLFAIGCRALDVAPSVAPTGAEALAQIVGIAAEVGRDLRDAHPSIEAADRVVENGISEKAFLGHVFNLETVRSWYVARALVVHNCRCWAEPVLEDLIDEEGAE
jgi:SPP1 gp7 family putative phage head morphogenesis protein